MENVSNGGRANSNWQWCGMRERRRLKRSELKVESEEQSRDPPFETYLLENRIPFFKPSYIISLAVIT